MSPRGAYQHEHMKVSKKKRKRKKFKELMAKNFPNLMKKNKMLIQKSKLNELQLRQREKCPHPDTSHKKF